MLEPGLALMVPAMHSLQVDAPAPLALPAGHVMHMAAFMVLLAVPAGHCAHTLLAVVEPAVMRN